MLARTSHLVDMARAEASPRLEQESPRPLTSTDTASPDYSRSGGFGDPTLAQAKGKILLAAMVDDLIAAVETFLVGKAGVVWELPCQPDESHQAVISRTREFTILFRVARRISTIQNRAANTAFQSVPSMSVNFVDNR